MANKFQQTREIVIHAQKYFSGRILDLGAGSGKYQGLIKEKATQYVAFDMAPGENIDVTGDALNLPFENETFDTVVSTQVLEHVEKPWVMIKEISRVLKKNGICFLTAPFSFPYHASPHDYFRYTKEGIESLFKNEGFAVLECQSYGRLFSALAEMAHFIIFPYKKKRGIWARRFVRYLMKTARFLDKFVKTQIIYSNVYIIAQKEN